MWRAARRIAAALRAIHDDQGRMWAADELRAVIEGDGARRQESTRTILATSVGSWPVPRSIALEGNMIHDDARQR
jgi:hypothetical protein